MFCDEENICFRVENISVLTPEIDTIAHIIKKPKEKMTITTAFLHIYKIFKQQV